MNKLKVITTLAFILITTFSITVPVTDTIKAAPAPTNAPIVLVEPSTISAIDFSSWDAFTNSIQETINDAIDSLQESLDKLKNYVEDTYGSVDEFIKDLINAYQNGTSS